LSLAYWKDNRLPVVVTRLFNTVGPRQTGQYGMVIPNFVQRALSGKPIMVHGDGKQSRCFAHVADVVEALATLIHTPAAYGEVINVGSNEEVSINDLALLVKQLAQSKSEIEHVPYEAVYGEGFEDMQRRVPSIEKVAKLIGWRPSRDLRTSVSDVVDWMRSNDSEARQSRPGLSSPPVNKR
jgi:UDP-glucose 4-epimerase